ncbi:MAG TPA: serine protease, partial [Armatimonadota bacterium]|nr:serine protease [Armatimonadota bacterium]
MRHLNARTTFAAIAAVAALTGGSRAQADPVSQPYRLAMCARPAVVRILDGYAGKYRWKDGQIYPVARIGSGSGFFLNPSGYIATNAHVTMMTHAGEEAGREMLFEEFVVSLAKAKGDDPEKVLKDEKTVAYIRENAKLVQFMPVHLVTTADGSRFPFEIKTFGVPDAGTGKDVSVIKIEVENAPVLKLGDDSRTKLLDRVLVIGYPGAAESDSLDDQAKLVASTTEGSVSAQKYAATGAPILQVSAPATHGNSGGPILN